MLRHMQNNAGDEKPKRKGSLSSVGQVLQRFNTADDRDKYVSQEWQLYGYNLAVELNDLKNKSLYIKMAKTYPRALLERARSFVKDAQNAKSKPRLFMWKVKELRKEKKTDKPKKVVMRLPFDSGE